MRLKGEAMQLIPRILLCLGLAATIVFAVVVRGHTVGAQSAPPAPSANVSAMGINFKPVGVADAATATLPNGGAAITRADALDVAGKHAMAYKDPRTITGVQYTARYGTFSDNQLHSADGPSQGQLEFVNRPVWVVSYYGPAVNIPLPSPAALAQPPVAHEITVVVDAASGQFLESYMG